MSKWLEERWKLFLPVLVPLGSAQEEQIKRLCEEELLMWKVRPSMKQANPLRKPLTETQNRIRESCKLQNELRQLLGHFVRYSLSLWLQFLACFPQEYAGLNPLEKQVQVPSSGWRMFRLVSLLLP